MRKLGQMVMKAVNLVHNDKIVSNGLEMSQLPTLIKMGQMVLKEVNWLHNDKMRSKGLERSQLGTH